MVIISHNDLPHVIRNLFQNQLSLFNLTDVSNVEPWNATDDSHTDIVRLRQGKVGAQVFNII